MTTAQIQAFRDAGLVALNHYAAVEFLAGGAVKTSALAVHLGTRAANVTGVVDALVKRGLVLRQPSRLDRRVVHLALSAAGEALAKILFPATP